MPARLEKQSDKNQFDKISSAMKSRVEAWCIEHAIFCFLILFILLSILFVVLIFTLVGVSATESGVVYNQFKNIV